MLSLHKRNRTQFSSNLNLNLIKIECAVRLVERQLRVNFNEMAFTVTTLMLRFRFCRRRSSSMEIGFRVVSRHFASYV